MVVLLLIIAHHTFVTCNNANSAYTSSRNCSVSQTRSVDDSDLIDLNISYPLLVLPPLKEVTYYDFNNTRAVLLSVATHISIRFVVEEKNAEVSQSDIDPVLIDFCESVQARSLNSESIRETLRLKTLHITMLSSEIAVNIEEFTIYITDNAIKVEAATLKGLINAISTIKQMLNLPTLVHIPLKIYDFPDYPYRGLMVDVARHFISLPLLKNAIDAMVASKMSVMHLHLTDASSFPVILHDTPLYQLSMLSSVGSLPSGRGDAKLYSRDDLRDLVNYAAERGIEIIPEIDIPSHTLSWGNAFPSIIVNCSSYAEHQEHPQNIYTLDPTNLSTLPIVYEVLKQISEIFPSQFFHVGGDEVHLECWLDLDSSSSRVDLLHDFMMDVFNVVKSLGKIPVGWQDSIDQNAFPYEPDEESLYKVNVDPTDVITFYTNDKFSVPRFASITKPNNYRTHSMLDIASTSWAVVEAWKCWQGLAGRASGIAFDNNLDVITAACWYLDFDSDFEVD